MQFSRYGAACAAALVAGCSSGSSPIVPATALPAAAAAPHETAAVAPDLLTVTARSRHGMLTLHVRVVRHHRPHRHARFVSPGTLGMTLAFSGASSLTKSVGLTPSSPGCTGSPSATTCTIALNLRPGSYTGTVSAFDAAPVSGAIPGNANLLSIAQDVPFSIKAGIDNHTTTFPLAGVVSSFGAPAYLPTAGTTATGVNVAAQDAGGNPITGTFAQPVVVTVNETGGSGHATISLNGGSGTSQASVTKAGDTLTLNYDGNGPSGYALSLGLSAAAVSGMGGGSATVKVTTLAFASASAEFSSGVLSLRGSGDVVPFTVTEKNAPSTPSIAVTGSGCAAIADATTPVMSSETGTFVVFARPVSSKSGCTLLASDGETTASLAVSNTYSVVEGTPAVTYFSNGISGGAGAQIAAGPDGAMWFAETTAPSHVGRIAATGTSPSIAEYALPTPDPVHLPQITGIAPGPDGKLWFAGYPYSTGIGNIATGGCAVACAQFAPQLFENPYAIVTGPDGAMWFTQPDQAGANYIGRATPDGTVTNEYSAGITPTAGVGNITVGPDGNLWFAEFNCSAHVGKITTAGAVTEYLVDYNHDVTTGPDGNIWIAGFSAIWKMTTSGAATPINNSYQLAAGNGQTYGAIGPYRLTTGPDGAIWYALASPASDGTYYIARIDPAQNAVTDAIPIGTGGRPEGLAAGTDGAIWFTGYDGAGKHAIGRIALQTSAAARRPSRSPSSHVLHKLAQGARR